MVFDSNDFLQWAEVLSADAFSAFEDAGLNDEKVRWGRQFKVLPVLLVSLKLLFRSLKCRNDYSNKLS